MERSIVPVSCLLEQLGGRTRKLPRHTSKEWMGRTRRPHFLGIEHLPRMSSHAPDPVCVREIVDLAKPTIEIGALVGRVGFAQRLPVQVICALAGVVFPSTAMRVRT